MPAGAIDQITGHKPQTVSGRHYEHRELDLLHLWLVKYEAWILDQAGIQFVPAQAGLQLVKG